MVERVEITDDKSAKAWLETQDHQTQVWFAVRCALRALPGVGIWNGATKNPLALFTMRANIVSAAAAWNQKTSESQKLTSAAKATFSAANSAFSGAPTSDKTHGLAVLAADAADYAVLSFLDPAQSVRSGAKAAQYSAQIDGGASYDATSRDSKNIENWGPLWERVNQPQIVQQGWNALKAQWAADDADWSFWIEWYEGILNGSPMDWDLIFKIATEITNEEWDAGQVRVAARIREIRHDYRTSVTPPLVRLPNGKWDVQSDTKIPAEPIEFAIAQVEIALTAALGADQGNGLTETSGETILIRKACADFRSLPSAVATSFWNACMGLQRNIGNLYPEDATLVALQNVLYTSVEELCEQDPLIRDRIAKLAALETRRMPTQEERENLQQVPEMVAEDLTPTAQEQLSEAVDVVANTEKPPRIWRAKLVNWLNTLGRGLDGAQKNEKRVSWLLKLARNISGWFFEEE